MLASALLDTGSYTRNALETTVPVDSELDMYLIPETGRMFIDANGLPVTGYIISSQAGVFDGPNDPLSAVPSLFRTDDDYQISNQFLSTPFHGVADLGAGLLGTADNVNLPSDISITYTVEGVAGIFSSQLKVVPEPSTFMLAAFGLVALGACARRRRVAGTKA